MKFSDEGSNRRLAELQAWVNFCDFLDGCEGECEYTTICMNCKHLTLLCAEGNTECSIEDVLIFITGCERLPAQGFGGRRLRVEFLDQGIFCTSSTCDLTLRLPVSHTDNYQAFKAATIMSLKGNNGFSGL